MMTSTVEPTLGLTQAVGQDKPLVRMFLSHADLDADLVGRLWGLLDSALRVDQTYRFDLWMFRRSIVVGEDWDTRIRDALATCELGLVAISNALLGSSYITNVELPALLDVPGKRVIPVAVRHTSPHADWHRLGARQIYGRQRPFSDVRGLAARDRWVNGLVDQIHQVLARYQDTGQQGR